MKTNFQSICEQLEAKIVSAYNEGVSLEDAEKLASEFLFAQLAVSTELKNADLESRMRKSGVKAVRAAVYSNICSTSEKKPTESALDHQINMDKLVSDEQDALDKAEVDKSSLERYYQIFREAHIHFRGVSRGRMD